MVLIHLQKLLGGETKLNPIIELYLVVSNLTMEGVEKAHVGVVPISRSIVTSIMHELDELVVYRSFELLK